MSFDASACLHNVGHDDLAGLGMSRKTLAQTPHCPEGPGRRLRRALAGATWMFSALVAALATERLSPPMATKPPFVSARLPHPHPHALHLAGRNETLIRPIVSIEKRAMQPHGETLSPALSAIPPDTRTQRGFS